MMKEPQEIEEAIRVIETFDNLPVQRRVEIFRDLTSKAREALIANVARPGEIIRRISEEEMFFTIKELGEEDALALISATTGKQLLYLLDIDLWKEDMFDTPAADRWFKILSRIGEEKILQFVQVADPELVLSAMSRFIKVVMRNPDVDLIEQQDVLPFFTLDDIFFIEFRFRESEDVLKRFLETIFHWKPEYYFGLMEELAWGVSLENEEAAGKWRRARLADRGFPEFDEALEIYSYLDRGSISLQPLEPSTTDPDAPTEVRSVLRYPLKVLDPNIFLRRCLNEIADQGEKDRLSTELAHLANKVMVADARDPGSIEEVHGSLRKVSGYINIALEETCGDNIMHAIGLIRSNHMEILFRRGFSLILDLRKEAHKLVRDYEGGVENLGHPLAELLNGLFQKRPIFASNVLGDDKNREFEQLDDIVRIRKMMDRTAVEEHWEPI